MSNDYLRILPHDPGYVPSFERLQAALALFQGFVPKADSVELIVSAEVRFVDAGINFERVLCPSCTAELTDWWGHAMAAAHESRYEALVLTVPCCGTSTSLNDLIYEWPMGFARFVLEARNANIGGGLSASQVAELQVLLGCRVKQVLARY